MLPKSRTTQFELFVYANYLDRWKQNKLYTLKFYQQRYLVKPRSSQNV